MHVTTVSPLNIKGDSEMANLINHYDWSATPLGSQEFWPTSLRFSLELMINAAFPMYLFWGNELTCFYNDGFRKILGSQGMHPTALGKPAKEIWTVNWESMQVLINQVLEGEQSTSFYEDQFGPIFRNGKMDDAYWTFSYNPIKNDLGKVEGILAIVYETTDKVKEKQKSNALKEQLELALGACELGTFDLNLQTQVFSINDKSREIFGLNSHNVHLANGMDIIHPNDRHQVEQAMRKALDFRSGGSYHAEYTIIPPNSREHRVVRANGKAFFNEVGTAIRFAGTLQDITSEKLADRRSKKLQTLVDNSPNFMGMATMDGLMIYLNAAGREMFGLSPDFDITNLTNKDFYAEEQFHFIKNVVIPELDERKQWNGFVKMRHFVTGEEIPVHANYILIADPDTGEIISRGATFRDLRPELATQKELLASDKRFRNLVQQAPVATAIYTGREMQIQWANDAMIRLWGKDESVVGKTIREALPELEGQPFHQLLDNVFTSGEFYQAEEGVAHLVVNGDLQSFYFNYSYKPLRDADGNIYGILNMAIDVTESVINKRKLQESETNFRSLIMQAPVGICLLSGDDHIVEIANDDYLELVGRQREGFVGRPIWEVVPEAKEQGFDQVLKKVKDTGEPFLGNEIPVMLVRNGRSETVYINFVYEPLVNCDQEVQNILVVAIDVTKQVEIRKSVESAEERFRLAIESAQLGSYSVNITTDEADASERLYELFDIDSPSLRMDFVSRIHPEDLPIRNKAHEIALETGRLEYECRIARRDGSCNWVRAIGRYYFDAAGKPEKIIGIVKDVTQEKAAEQELSRKVKERTEELTKLNEELQQLTYVSSHDLKEPLRKIHLFTNLIQEEVQGKDAQLQAWSGKILSAASRMSGLINDLLKFSTLSDTSEEHGTIDLNAVMKGVTEDLEVLIKEKSASIQFDHLPEIHGVSFQINQLFSNLLQNGFKFGKEALPVELQVNCSKVTDEEMRLYPSLTRKSYYKLEFSDNGIGFSPDFADKIFMVFQRLHNRNQYSGNGIGLAICKKIVQNHEGHIYAESTPGEGAKFVVILPASFN